MAHALATGLMPGQRFARIETIDGVLPGSWRVVRAFGTDRGDVRELFVYDASSRVTLPLTAVSTLYPA